MSDKTLCEILESCLWVAVGMIMETRDRVIETLSGRKEDDAKGDPVQRRE